MLRKLMSKIGMFLAIVLMVLTLRIVEIKSDYSTGNQAKMVKIQEFTRDSYGKDLYTIIGKEDKQV